MKDKLKNKNYWKNLANNKKKEAYILFTIFCILFGIGVYVSGRIFIFVLSILIPLN